MAGRKEGAYFDEAERLYVHENQTLEAVAEALHGVVSVTTLSNWKQKGGWDAKRKAALASPKTLSEKMELRLEALVNALEIKEGLSTADLMALPGIGDAIYKTFLVIEKLKKSQDLRTISIEVMREFGAFLKAQDIGAGELEIISRRIGEWFRSLE